MYDPDDWEIFEQSLRSRLQRQGPDPEGRRPHNRLGRGLPLVSHNELETRRFLAGEVYGVPDELLDDVLRVRLLDLDCIS